MQPFAQIAARAIRGVFDRFGEEWLLSPYAPAADVNAPAASDPMRSCVTLRGIYFDPQALPLIPNGFDPRTSQRPGTMGGKPRVEFLPDDVAACGGLRKDDQIANARQGVFRISSTFTKSHGVVVAYVNLIDEKCP